MNGEMTVVTPEIGSVTARRRLRGRPCELVVPAGDAAELLAEPTTSFAEILAETATLSERAATWWVVDGDEPRGDASGDAWTDARCC